MKISALDTAVKSSQFTLLRDQFSNAYTHENLWYNQLGFVKYTIKLFTKCNKIKTTKLYSLKLRK